VVYVPEQSAYYGFLSARETLEYALLIREIPPDRRRPETSLALEKVGLSTRADTRISALSMNSLRRLAIAHALVGRPRAVLVDETLSGADQPTVRDLVRALRDLATGGTTVLVASHDTSIPAGLGARTLMIGAQRVVGEYPPRSHGTSLRRVAERLDAVDRVGGES
jgi:ABC-2 type transport system ATP-binding protein